LRLLEAKQTFRVWRLESNGDLKIKKNQEPRSKIQIKKQKRKIKKMKNEKKSKKKIIYEYPIRLIGRGYFNRLSTRTRL